MSVAALESHTGDRQMTADRSEMKFVISPMGTAVLVRAVSAQLPTHHFRGPDATLLPDGLEYATTIYFDTCDRDLYRAAIAGKHDHLKVRAREYYSVHPSLTEIATDFRDLVRHTPVLWLEIKYKHGMRTQKRRVGIPKREVPAFFQSGCVTGSMVDLVKPSYGGDAGEVLEEVASVCRTYGKPLETDCVVNYRRTAWQNEGGTLRITLDRNVASFAPPRDLWTRDFKFVRETLGTPVQTLESTVVEIKSRGDLPAWLEVACSQNAVRTEGFSKFVAASRAVHGE